MWGQTMVEFASVLLLFLILIFAAFDFGRLFFVQMEVQQAVQEAGRYASTGNHLPDPNNPGQNLSRVNSIIAIAEQAVGGVVNFSSMQISSLQGGAGSAGGPGDTVTISFTTNLQLMTPIIARIFPNGQYTFTSSTTFKNEPFSANNTK
jgi:Flp pilus assembly protein TadG